MGQAAAGEGPAQSAASALAEGQGGIGGPLAGQALEAQGISAGGVAVEPSLAAEAGASSGQAAAASPVAGKAGPGGRTAASDTSRPGHGLGKIDAAGPGSPSGQTPSLTADASALVRDAAGERGAMNQSGETAGGGTGASAASGSRDTFAALDSEGAQVKPIWVHAGAQRAEAGFQDPALGWVGVRADSSGGGIHASVVADSTAAAQTLGSHLAGLNAYLAEHHGEVHAVTMSAPAGGWADANAGQGGAHQETGQGAGQGLGPQPGEAATSGAISSGRASGTFEPDMGAQSARPGGAHISVMA